VPDFEDEGREDWLECEADRLKHFVGRGSLLSRVRDLISTPQTSAESGGPPVLLFHGVGGSGKTTLLDCIRERYCRKREDLPEDQREDAPHIPHARIDFRDQVDSAATLCRRIASAFAGPPWNIELPRLETAWERYEKLLRQHPTGGARLLGTEGRVMDLADNAALLEKPVTAILKAGRWLVRLGQEPQLRAKLPERFYDLPAEELEKYLPQALAEDLSEVAQDHRFPGQFQAQRPVLFFDTLEVAEPDQAGAAASTSGLRGVVRRLARHARGPLVIIGSRHPPEWDGDPLLESYPIEELSDEDCLEYLDSRSADLEMEGLGPLPGDLWEPVYKLTKGHALFLGVCADICVEAVRRGEAVTADTLDIAHAEDSDEKKLFYLLDTLLREATNDLRTLVRLAAFPLYFDRDVLRAALTRESREDFRERFARLRSLSFVVPVTDAPGVYSLHPSVRTLRVALEAEDAPEGFCEVHRRIRDHLAPRLAMPETSDGAQWEDERTPFLISAWAYSTALSDAEDGDAAVHDRCWGALELWHNAEARRILSGWREATGIHAALGWRLLICEAVLLGYEGRWPAASGLLGAALTAAETSDDPRGISHVKHEQARSEQRLGHSANALKLYGDSLQLSRRLGDRRWEAVALQNMAAIESERGDPVRAMDLCEEGLAICREIGNGYVEGSTLLAMARLRRLAGDLDGAMELCESCREVVGKLGSPALEHFTLHEMGVIHEARGEYGPATEVFEECLQNSREVGSPEGEASQLSWLSSLYALKGHWGRSKAALRRCAELVVLVGTPAGVWDLGTALAQTKKLALADRRKHAGDMDSIARETRARLSPDLRAVFDRSVGRSAI
jgi:tetratricopeptide (TPR) repeat protein